VSLLHALQTFQTGAYDVKREAAGTRTDGEWAAGSITTYSAQPMEITPVSNTVLKTLPEGAVAETTRTVRCAFDLLIRDIVRYDAGDGRGTEDWRVIERRRWNVRGVRYTRALIARDKLGV
jgi:hypothetical protein